MGNVLGIVAEYNPFHNGHLFHLNSSKKISGCDYSVAIISGNFTQRGSASIIDKWSRAEIALLNGIDLVLELPVLYSISSAENFADGAIKILDSLGIIDYLSFGAECTNIEVLNNIADILYTEPLEYKSFLSKELKKGLSFPKARENAILFYINNQNKSNNYNSYDCEDYKSVLSCPNNILGIEYLKALKKYESNIKPILISRAYSKHNSFDFSNNIASSTAIRNLIKNNSFEKFKSLVPLSSYSILMKNIENGTFVNDISCFEKEIIYNLRKMSISDISELPDVSEGFEYAIKNAINNCNSVSELLNSLKSKRYTSTRIQRILLYSLLNISKKDIQISKNITPYVRVLGFNNNGKNLISEICRKNPNIKVITSVKKFLDYNLDSNLNLLLNKDILSTNVYTTGFEKISPNNLDLKKEIIKLDN